MKWIRKYRVFESIQGTIPFLFGIILSSSEFNILTLCFVLLTFFLGQLSIYNINDHYDYKMDQKNPRKLKEYLKFFPNKVLFIIFILPMTLQLIYPLISFLIATFIYILCILYSHPLFRFKAYPLASMTCHFLFGFVSLYTGALFFTPFNKLSSSLHLLALFFGLSFLTASHFGQILDSKYDRPLSPYPVHLIGERKSLFLLFLFHFGIIIGMSFFFKIYYTGLFLMILYSLHLIYLLQSTIDQNALLNFQKTYRFVFSLLSLTLFHQILLGHQL